MFCFVCVVMLLLRVFFLFLVYDYLNGSPANVGSINLVADCFLVSFFFLGYGFCCRLFHVGKFNEFLISFSFSFQVFSFFLVVLITSCDLFSL